MAPATSPKLRPWRKPESLRFTLFIAPRIESTSMATHSDIIRHPCVRKVQGRPFDELHGTFFWRPLERTSRKLFMVVTKQHSIRRLTDAERVVGRLPASRNREILRR